MKRLLTVLLALVAMVGISYAQQQQHEVVYQADFNNKWDEWTTFDVDQEVFHPAVLKYLADFKGTDYDKAGKKASWARLEMEQRKVLATFSLFQKTNAVADDWLISPEITLKDACVLQLDIKNLGGNDKIEIYIAESGDKPSDFTNKVTTISPFPIQGSLIYNALIDLPEFQNKTVRIALRHHNKRSSGLIVSMLRIVNIPEENRNLQVYLDNIDLPAKAKQNVNFEDITFVVSNEGLKKLTSFDLVIECDGLNENIRHSFTTDLLNLQAAEFTIPVPFAFTNIGNHTLKIYTENLNGTNAKNSGDPKYTSFTNDEFEVFDPENTTRLMSIIEHFTASTCPPCAQVSPLMQPLYEGNIENLAVIKYPTNWPGNGDPYYSKDVADRVKTYNVTGVPAIFLNASKFNLTFKNLQPENFQQRITSVHNPGYATINNPTYKLDKNTRKINFSMDISNYAPDVFNQKNTKIRVALIEFTTVKNASTNGETKFHYVFHEMIPNTKGIPFTSKGKDDFQKVSIEHAIKTKNIENIDNLGFVVFVQDDKDKTLLQSAWVAKASSVEADNSGNGVVGVYPNPTTDVVKVKYVVKGTQKVTAELVNAKGAVVGNYDFGTKEEGTYTGSIDATTLPAGNYFLNLRVGNFSFPNTISVVR